MSGASSLTPEDGRLYVTEGGAITRTVADILSSPSRAKAAATMADLRSSNPKDVPLRRTVLDGIKGRHAAVDASQDPVATAKDMAYLSHLDRRDLLDEIDRLTRERDTAREALRISEQRVREHWPERERLRTALAGLKDDLTCNECVPCKRINAEIDASLSGEHSAPETSAEPRIRLRITPRSQEVYEALVKFQRIGELADIELAPPEKADELRELHDRRAAEKGWPTSENG